MADIHPDDKLDLAIDFALGLLSEADEKSLLAAARQDAELEKLLREQCAARERARADGRPAAAASRADQPLGTRHAGFTRRRTVALVSLVAALAAFVVLFPAGHDADQVWLPLDDLVGVQRSSTSGAAELRTGLDAYAARDLTAAIAALRAANVKGAWRDLRDLYLASALLNSGQKENARQVLSAIDIESLPFPWRDRGLELQRLCRP